MSFSGACIPRMAGVGTLFRCADDGLPLVGVDNDQQP
jgi:hypothetical protein